MQFAQSNSASEILISFIRYWLLNKAKGLKEIEGYTTVYLSPNSTHEERIARRKLVAELKEKRTGAVIRTLAILSGKME